MTAFEPELEEVRCPLGCPTHDTFVFSGHDRLYGLPGEFDILRCDTCGLMRTSPRPDAASIGFYYPAEYAPHQEGSIGPPSGTHTGRRPRRSRGPQMLRGLLDTRARAIPLLPPGRILEFGCGNGDFLQTMVEQGWEAVGLDLSPHAVAASRRRGLDVHLGSPESLEAEQRFDLIVGWMALEHLPDPVRALQHMAELADRGARLAVSVPRCDTLEFKLFRDGWYSLHLPHHFWHFTAASIDRVLRAAGWETDAIIDQRSLTNVVVSIGWRLEESGRLPRLAQRLTTYAKRPGRLRFVLAPAAVAAAAIGQTGRMTVWATLRES